MREGVLHGRREPSADCKPFALQAIDKQVGGKLAIMRARAESVGKGERMR
jgi:hypothetical protein